MKRIEVFTDGASGKDGAGGWAWWVSDDDNESGHFADTTNQRMEMYAALKAIEAHKGVPITVVSDSAYVVNCFRDKWYRKWRLNGWKNGKGKDVKNHDLWARLLNAYDAHGDVEFRHVRGHMGIHGNVQADLMAVEAKMERRRQENG